MEESHNISSESRSERDELSGLHRAAYRGDVEAVRTILDEGANPNGLDSQGNTPLYWACFKSALSASYVEVVRLLLGAGAVVDQFGPDAGPPLFVACRAGVVEVVSELIRAGADVRVQWGNRVAIAIAAEGGSIECVQALLAAGADPSGRGDFGLNAREWAQANGFDRIVEVLDAASRPQE